MMPDLIAKNPEAAAWMREALAAQAGQSVFGRLASSIIWTNDADDKGVLLVPLDPNQLAAKINADPFPLLLGHDPGRPLGKVLGAKVFENSTGEVFVAAVLGLYENAPRQGFRDLGLNSAVDVPSPATLASLPADLRFVLTADPREVNPSLLDDLARAAPVPTDVRARSNNAADALHAFVTVSVLFAALVWNPFVTTLAEEAGRDAYAAIRSWLKKISARMVERHNPVIEVQSFHGDCCISFMFRGGDVGVHYKAHEALSAASARAAHLVAQMLAARLGPVRLVYEFHTTEGVWHPSFAELSDGRLVTDNTKLIAIEQLPPGLSLGLIPASLPESVDRP